MATVLFAGFGDLGSAAGRLLADAGLRVQALKRTAPVSAWPGIDCHAVDLRAPFTLPAAARGEIDAVVIAVSPQRHERDDYRATYVGAVEHTLRAGQAAGGRPRLVLFVSSTSVWAESGDLWISEDTPARPDSWNGEILLAAEQALFNSSLALQGAQAVSLRLSGIYGPGRYMMIRKAEAIRAGREAMPSPAWTNRIHRDDAARMVAFLVNRALAGTALERIYTGVDNEPSLNVDVLAHIMALLQGDAAVDITTKAPPPNVAVGGKRVSNARIRSLGFSFRYPDFRTGYDALVAEYRRPL